MKIKRFLLLPTKPWLALSFKNRGFTLIETIVYMALSTFICTSLIGFSLTLVSAQARTTENLETELTGTTILRLIEISIKNNLPYEQLISTTTSSITHFSLATTTNLTTISFLLDSHHFSLSFKP